MLYIRGMVLLCVVLRRNNAIDIKRARCRTVVRGLGTYVGVAVAFTKVQGEREKQAWEGCDFTTRQSMSRGHQYLLKVGGVEADHDVNAENSVDDVVKDEHAPTGVLPEGDPPRNNHHAVHDHRAHEEVPVQLARVLSFERATGR